MRLVMYAWGKRAYELVHESEYSDPYVVIDVGPASDAVPIPGRVRVATKSRVKHVVVYSDCVTVYFESAKPSFTVIPPKSAVVAQGSAA